MRIYRHTFFVALLGILFGCAAPPATPPSAEEKREIASEITVDMRECAVHAPEKFQSMLKELCATTRPYIQHEYIPRLTITPLYTLTERGGVFWREENRIEIPEAVLSTPIFPNEAELILFHEFIHPAEKSMELSGATKSMQILARAYEVLVTSAGFDTKTSYLHFSPLTELNPLFSIFDESSYTQGAHPSPYGHPYGSASELFASALTIFRFFPNEFVSRFKTLNTNAQEAIQYVTKEIFNAILLYNADREALKKLIPEYEMILKEIS